MSSSNGCFLTCIQISQEAGQVVWYSHLFQNFPQFIVIHTVKDFGKVNEAEIDVFLKLSGFFDDPTDVGNSISGSSVFFKTSLNIWKFTVHVLLKPGLENFEHYFTSVWNECNCVVVWAFFGIAFLWDSNENWPFPVLWPLLSFPICWHIECSTFTASSFRIWNISIQILSSPLAFFVLMLSKPHLSYIPGCLALGEWSHHCDYLGHEDLFCTVLCSLATSLVTIICHLEARFRVAPDREWNNWGSSNPPCHLQSRHLCHANQAPNHMNSFHWTNLVFPPAHFSHSA